jgi:hypothetical protein
LLVFDPYTKRFQLYDPLKMPGDAVPKGVALV